MLVTGNRALFSLRSLILGPLNSSPSMYVHLAYRSSAVYLALGAVTAFGSNKQRYLQHL
jgi:hypothetical protein